MRTAIENAVVLTMDDDMRVLDRGYVLTDGKNIAEVGEGAFAGEADERIDARGASCAGVCEHALPCVDGAVPHDGRRLPGQASALPVPAGKRGDDARAGLSRARCSASGKCCWRA